MKIEIPVVNNRKFYKELLNVSMNRKKIINDHKSKVFNLVDLFTIPFSVSLILLIIYLVYAAINNISLFSFLGVFLLALTLIFFLGFYIVESTVNSQIKNQAQSILIIDKNGIRFKKLEMDVLIKFEELKCVLVKKYGIMFISDEVILDVPVEYLDQVKEGLNKFNDKSNIVY